MKRFTGSVQGQEFESEYDLPTDEIWDIQNRGIGPIRIYNNINLAAAGSLNVQEIGYGFALYAQNASTGLIYTEAFVNCYVNTKDASDPSRNFPLKCGRGYIGSFQHLYLNWPADTSDTYNVQLVIYKSCHYPWTGGEEAT